MGAGSSIAGVHGGVCSSSQKSLWENNLRSPRHGRCCFDYAMLSVNASLVKDDVPV